MLRNSFCIIFCIFSTIFHSLQVSAQDWKWAFNATGNNQFSDIDVDIAVDRNGNQFIAGYFTDSLIMGSFRLFNPDDHYSDMFLARLDSSGNVIWAKSIELNSSYNDAVALCLDDSSNIFLTGSMDGKIFVSKYDENGGYKWDSNILQKNYYGYGYDIAIDQFEHIYLTGGSSGSAVLSKLDKNGTLIWSSIVIGCHSNGALGIDLAVDRFGNAYVAGRFSCDSVIVGKFVLRTSSRTDAAYYAKYSPVGEVIWAEALTGNTNRFPQVAVTDDGNVVTIAIIIFL